jgi:FkbM family methyltransferase
MLGKLKTAGSLLARGDLGGFSRNCRLNLRRLRLAWHRGRPFLHRRMGFPFPCYPDIADSVELFLQEGHDTLELALVRAWVEPGDAAVDVGANLGIYSVTLATAAGRAGSVLALEPSPLLSARLAETARRLALAPIRILEVCAGSEPGETAFFVSEGPGSTGEQSSRPDPARRDQYRRITAKVDTLDRLVPAQLAGRAPSLVKMDVEGAEVLALGGAHALLGSGDSALWLVEVNPPTLLRFDAGPADLLRSFPERQFEAWLIPHYPRVPGTPAPPRPLAGGERFQDAAFYNLVALPRDGRWAGRSPRIRRLLEADRGGR